MIASEVLAHGVGGRQDLPIPFSFALVGAAVAVAVSFIALAVAWREPRLGGDTAGRPVPARLQALVDGGAFRALLRAIGLLAAAFVAVVAVLGPNTSANPAPGFVYVLFWVGLIPASLLFGPVWKVLNPLRTIHRGLAALTGIRTEVGLLTYPARLGYWPAAAGLFAFVWLELVAPERTAPSTLVVWFTAYAGVQLLAALAFGSAWFERGDAFEVYSTLIGRLAPLGRRVDGRLVLRNPLDGLDGLRPAPGLVAAVCVLLGSTAYDSISESPFWLRTVQSSPLSSTVVETIGLAGVVLLIGGMFAAAVATAGRTGELTYRGLPSAFAHSIVPIFVGYLIAHYFSLLIFEGQRTIILTADPFDTGIDLFGIAGQRPDYALISATAIATVQVLAVVVGHVTGVLAAHDRAVKLFPPRRAVLGQIPLLVLMICYTVGGLTLLFAA